MNDQALQTLRSAGFDVRPTATLDRDGALFALTEDTLIYLDDRGPKAVNLRDITRIHSDRDGILRVEGPSGTAITAPLVGFEVSRVQHFFAEVRHATARAKTLPTPTSVTSATPWKTGFSTAAPADAPPEPSPAVHPATPPEPRPAPAPAPVTANDDNGGATVVVRPRPTSTPTAPEESEPAARTAEPIRINTAPQRRAEPTPTSTPETGPVHHPPAASSGTPGAPQLAHFAPTLRLLAVLMAVTGLGVGVLTWMAGAYLAGLWTIGVGFVGAFALYVFGEVVRAVAYLVASATTHRE